MDRRTSRSWIALVGISVLIALTAACGSPEESSETSQSALAQAGRWTLPANVKSAGAQVRVAYDEAPRWGGAAACSGRLKTGGQKLGGYLVDRFAVVTSVGGYACRRNTADSTRMSVHGTGRALDVFVPRTGGAADNGQGDKVANWLVANAQRIGVQLVIWDRTIWRANGTSDAAYTGPHPHDDHLHVELSDEGGAATTPWFDAMDDGAGNATADAGNDDDDDDATTADAGARADASADARADARTDAGASTGTVDAGKDAAPVDPDDDDAAAPPGEKPTTPNDPSTPSDPNASEPPGNDPSTGFESAGDEPGATDSLDNSRRSRARPSSLDGEPPVPVGGCSAAPRGASHDFNSLGSGGGAFGLGLGLVLSRWLARRRRSRASS